LHRLLIPFDIFVTGLHSALSLIHPDLRLESARLKFSFSPFFLQLFLLFFSLPVYVAVIEPINKLFFLSGAETVSLPEKGDGFNPCRDVVG
jgi:hypothetical protein